MISCPVGSIRTHQSDPIVKTVIDQVFPAEIDALRSPGVGVMSVIPPSFLPFPLFSSLHIIHVFLRLLCVRAISFQVMHLGFHSALSFGATPYFIRRPGGNIMIDSPRFNAK